MASQPAYEGSDASPICGENERNLLDRLASWARAFGWDVEREVLVQDGSREYRQDLLLRAPEGELHVEVKGALGEGRRARIDLMAWPTLYRVRLLRGADEPDWSILTDSGVYVRKPLDAETFGEIALDLLRAG